MDSVASMTRNTEEALLANTTLEWSKGHVGISRSSQAAPQPFVAADGPPAPLQYGCRQGPPQNNTLAQSDSDEAFIFINPHRVSLEPKQSK